MKSADKAKVADLLINKADIEIKKASEEIKGTIAILFPEVKSKEIKEIQKAYIDMCKNGEISNRELKKWQLLINATIAIEDIDKGLELHEKLKNIAIEGLKKAGQAVLPALLKLIKG